MVNLRSRHTERLHPGWVKNDLNLAAYPAPAPRLGHAFDRQKPLGDDIVDEPAQLLNRHIVSFDGVNAKETARNIDLANARLQNAVGQISSDAVDCVFDFRSHIIGIKTQLKFDKSV